MTVADGPPSFSPVTHPAPESPVAPKKRDTLYLQVLAAIVFGVLVGWLKPEWGLAMQPLGDGFIKLIKMIIAPIIFCTVVVGIAGMEIGRAHV